jgi:hypothetical protein
MQHTPAVQLCTAEMRCTMPHCLAVGAQLGAAQRAVDGDDGTRALPPPRPPHECQNVGPVLSRCSMPAIHALFRTTLSHAIPLPLWRDVMHCVTHAAGHRLMHWQAPPLQNNAARRIRRRRYSLGSARPRTSAPGLGPHLHRDICTGTHLHHLHLHICTGTGSASAPSGRRGRLGVARRDSAWLGSAWVGVARLGPARRGSACTRRAIGRIGLLRVAGTSAYFSVDIGLVHIAAIDLNAGPVPV